jgi:hypothetical protein
MFFTPHVAMDLLRDAGLGVPKIDFRSEASTRQANAAYISDDDFFRLLGIPKIKALDVSDYEGADIAHDLTKPIPGELEGVADFILDGSTLDNVFDPATVLRNTTRLLKPRGRLVSVNVATNSYGPYIIPTAHLLLDYFTINGFSDCKVYLLVYGGPNGGVNVFTPDLTLMRQSLPQPRNFTSPHTTALVVMAEKGSHSTWDQSPVQHQYRVEWDRFAANLSVIEASKRPELAYSTEDRFFGDTEYLFIDQNGTRHPGATVHPEPAPASVAPEQPAAPVAVVEPNLNVSGWALLREIGRRAVRKLFPPAQPD